MLLPFGDAELIYHLSLGFSCAIEVLFKKHSAVCSVDSEFKDTAHTFLIYVSPFQKDTINSTLIRPVTNIT